MLLGPQCVDPFWRQCVRVSMGTVFKLPLVRLNDLAEDLRRLGRDLGVELLATVLDDDAEPIERVRRAKRTGILFGNEAQGLSAEAVELCQRRVTIPMRLGTDSLNVAVSAGIFMYVLSGQKDRII
jgi:tRNA G18 (ribose-2'-O)-methylase SpoU